MDYKELNDLIVSKKSFKINNINFDIKDNFGHRIVQGISFKYCKIVQRYDGYNYKLERREKI